MQSLFQNKSRLRYSARIIRFKCTFSSLYAVCWPMDPAPKDRHCPSYIRYTHRKGDFGSFVDKYFCQRGKARNNAIIRQVRIGERKINLCPRCTKIGSFYLVRLRRPRSTRVARRSKPRSDGLISSRPSANRQKDGGQERWRTSTSGRVNCPLSTVHCPLNPNFVPSWHVIPSDSRQTN